MRVSPAHRSVLRMIPTAARTALAGRGRLGVYRLLNTIRGWDTHQTPVVDVEWALDQLGLEFGPELPVALIGHSLGGRAALLAGGAPQVRTVVALAPWLYPGEDVPLRGRQVLFVHGDEDRVASATRAMSVARQLEVENDVGFISVLGGKHAMLRRHGVFDGAAADFAVSTLLHEPVRGPVSAIMQGRSWLEV
ncbi:alpha/beta hydrolase [Phycicoccus sp. Root101]|uniref:alpha/beta hydrolase n=1 Tax=Phycicoccus sp. Root101 TaxID=1736421 RepID=UPI001F489689|nr:alpha/beta hydrolase [Phycicoccus sp. Root101]